MKNISILISHILFWKNFNAFHLVQVGHFPNTFYLPEHWSDFFKRYPVISDIATDVILERCTQQCLFDQLCIWHCLLNAISSASSNSGSVYSQKRSSVLSLCLKTEWINCTQVHLEANSPSLSLLKHTSWCSRASPSLSELISSTDIEVFWKSECSYDAVKLDPFIPLAKGTICLTLNFQKYNCLH